MILFNFIIIIFCRFAFRIVFCSLSVNFRFFFVFRRGRRRTRDRFLVINFNVVLLFLS
eukprot:09299.XXX_102843_103025_1 [CDS] Oithona nana genome sequencing.